MKITSSNKKHIEIIKLVASVLTDSYLKIGQWKSCDNNFGLFVNKPTDDFVQWFNKAIKTTSKTNDFNMEYLEIVDFPDVDLYPDEYDNVFFDTFIKPSEKFQHGYINHFGNLILSFKNKKIDFGKAKDFQDPQKHLLWYIDQHLWMYKFL